MTLEDKLFSFDGRLRRRDFWLLGIGLGLIQVVLAQMLIYLMVGPQALLAAGPDAMLSFSLPMAINLIVTLVFLWPTLALIAKRKHDRGGSAAIFIFLELAWIALTFFPVGMVTANEATAVLTRLLLGALSLPIGIWFLVDLGILDGTSGDNEYGPSPKGADRTATMIAAFE